MKQALKIAPFQSNQPRYNLFDRQIEAEDIPFCEREGIGILPHSPLAKGLLAGKYTPDRIFAADDERSCFPRFQGETFARYLAVVEELKGVARDKGVSLIQLAIAWLLRLSAITCVLVGGRNPEQVKEHAGVVGVTFSDAELTRIEDILVNTPDA
jgi:aryl-alcohol dehydrogenase-like predicted oxidoreductase